MEVEIGKVTHYYNHLNVAVLKLNESIKVGDEIHFLGHLTDFTQIVTSMEINHHIVTRAKAGDDVAVKVLEPVREHDLVYKVTEDMFAPAI